MVERGGGLMLIQYLLCQALSQTLSEPLGLHSGPEWGRHWASS